MAGAAFTVGDDVVLCTPEGVCFNARVEQPHPQAPSSVHVRFWGQAYTAFVSPELVLCPGFIDGSIFLTGRLPFGRA